MLCDRRWSMDCTASSSATPKLGMRAYAVATVKEFESARKSHIS